MAIIKNIKEVTEPLKEQVLKGDVNSIDEMRAWLKPLGYSDTINEADVNFILREFVMSNVYSNLPIYRIASKDKTIHLSTGN